MLPPADSPTSPSLDSPTSNGSSDTNLSSSSDSDDERLVVPAAARTISPHTTTETVSSPHQMPLAAWKSLVGFLTRPGWILSPSSIPVMRSRPIKMALPSMCLPGLPSFHVNRDVHVDVNLPVALVSDAAHMRINLDEWSDSSCPTRIWNIPLTGLAIKDYHSLINTAMVHRCLSDDERQLLRLLFSTSTDQRTMQSLVCHASPKSCCVIMEQQHTILYMVNEYHHADYCALVILPREARHTARSFLPTPHSFVYAARKNTNKTSVHDGLVWEMRHHLANGLCIQMPRPGVLTTSFRDEQLWTAEIRLKRNAQYLRQLLKFNRHHLNRLYNTWQNTSSFCKCVVKQGHHKTLPFSYPLLFMHHPYPAYEDDVDPLQCRIGEERLVSRNHQTEKYVHVGDNALWVPVVVAQPQTCPVVAEGDLIGLTLTVPVFHRWWMAAEFCDRKFQYSRDDERQGISALLYLFASNISVRDLVVPLILEYMCSDFQTTREIGFKELVTVSPLLLSDPCEECRILQSNSAYTHHPSVRPIVTPLGSPSRPLQRHAPVVRTYPTYVSPPAASAPTSQPRQKMKFCFSCQRHERVGCDCTVEPLVEDVRKAWEAYTFHPSYHWYQQRVVQEISLMLILMTVGVAVAWQSWILLRLVFCKIAIWVYIMAIEPNVKFYRQTWSSTMLGRKCLFLYRRCTSHRDHGKREEEEEEELLSSFAVDPALVADCDVSVRNDNTVTETALVSLDPHIQCQQNGGVCWHHHPHTVQRTSTYPIRLPVYVHTPFQFPPQLATADITIEWRPYRSLYIKRVADFMHRVETWSWDKDWTDHIIDANRFEYQRTDNGVITRLLVQYGGKRGLMFGPNSVKTCPGGAGGDSNPRVPAEPSSYIYQKGRHSETVELSLHNKTTIYKEDLVNKKVVVNQLTQTAVTTPSDGTVRSLPLFWKAARIYVLPRILEAPFYQFLIDCMVPGMSGEATRIVRSYLSDRLPPAPNHLCVLTLGACSVCTRGTPTDHFCKIKSQLPLDAVMVVPVTKDYFGQMRKKRTDKLRPIDIQQPVEGTEIAYVDPNDDYCHLDDAIGACASVWRGLTTPFVYRKHKLVHEPRLDTNRYADCAEGLHGYDDPSAVFVWIPAAARHARANYVPATPGLAPLPPLAAPRLPAALTIRRDSELVPIMTTAVQRSSISVAGDAATTTAPNACLHCGVLGTEKVCTKKECRDLAALAQLFTPLYDTESTAASGTPRLSVATTPAAAAAAPYVVGTSNTIDAIATATTANAPATKPASTLRRRFFP